MTEAMNLGMNSINIYDFLDKQLNEEDLKAVTKAQEKELKKKTDTAP